MQSKAHCKAWSAQNMLLMTTVGPRAKASRTGISSTLIGRILFQLRQHHFYQALCSSQTWLIMKLTTFLLTAAFLHVQARGLTQEITFSGTDVPIQKVFAAI